MKIAVNGLPLQMCRLHNYVQQPVLTSDGSDWVCDRVMVDMECVYNPKATSYAGTTPTPGQLPAQTDAAIRHYLSEPRVNLLLQDEASNTIISSPPAGNTTDCMGGPRLLSLSVSEIGGTKTWKVRIAIETFVNTCPSGGSGSPLVANRFSQTHHVDDAQYTSISTVGQTWFQLDSLEDAGNLADFYRAMVVPPVTKGFRRVSLDVNVSPLGNQLNWQAVDRELPRPLQVGDNQWGVLTFKADYMQQSVRAEGSLGPGGLLTHVFTARVVGIPSGTRANLIVFAYKMALAKIPVPNNPRPGQDIGLADLSVHEHVDDNAIDFRMVAIGPAAGAQGGQMGGLQTGIFLQGGADFQYRAFWLDQDNLGPSYGNGSSVRTPTVQALAFASALQAACTTPSPIKGSPSPGASDSNTTSSESYSLGVTIGDANDLASNSTKWSSANSSGVYHEYRLDLRYDTHTNREMVPVAGPADDSGSGGPMKGHTDDNGNWVPDSGSPTCEVITLGLPYGTMVADWTALRQGEPPQPPDPDVLDSNAVLLHYSKQPAAPCFMADGNTPVFRAAGRYTYALRSPVMPGDSTPIPATPNTIVAFNQYQLDDDTHGLIDSATPDWSGPLIAPTGPST